MLPAKIKALRIQLHLRPGEHDHLEFHRIALGRHLFPRQGEMDQPSADIDHLRPMHIDAEPQETVKGNQVHFLHQKEHQCAIIGADHRPRAVNLPAMPEQVPGIAELLSEQLSLRRKIAVFLPVQFQKLVAKALLQNTRRSLPLSVIGCDEQISHCCLPCLFSPCSVGFQQESRKLPCARAAQVIFVRKVLCGVPVKLQDALRGCLRNAGVVIIIRRALF